MAFTFTNYANPELSKSPINDIISNLFGGYEQGVKASYMQPTLAEALKKSQLYNQYYGPNMESQIGLRHAQTGEAGARTSLLGEQTRGARLENEFLPQVKQAQIQQLQASAEKARILQMIREQMLGGGNVNNPLPTEGSSSMGLFEGQGMPNAIQQQMMQGSGQPMEQPIQQPQQLPFGGDYSKAAIASQMLGLGQPKIVEANGKFLAITPFGVMDTGVQGLTAEQKALQSGFGKYGAKLYGDSVDAYKSYQNQGLALDELIDSVDSNPQFRNVVGRIKKPLTNWFGSPAQKELLGRLQSQSGEIALQVAPALKGAFTGRDQTLINEIKASPNDFPDVFIGKLKAQKLINQVLTERSKITAELVEKGYKPIEASKLAALYTPLDKYRQQVKELTMHHEILSPSELDEAKRILAARGGK